MLPWDANSKRTVHVIYACGVIRNVGMFILLNFLILTTQKAGNEGPAPIGDMVYIHRHEFWVSSRNSVCRAGCDMYRIFDLTRRHVCM